MIMVRFLAILDTVMRAIISTVLTRSDCLVRTAAEGSIGALRQATGAGPDVLILVGQAGALRKFPLNEITVRDRLCRSAYFSFRGFELDSSVGDSDTSSGSPTKRSAAILERKSQGGSAPRVGDRHLVLPIEFVAQVGLVAGCCDCGTESVETQPSQCMSRQHRQQITSWPEGTRGTYVSRQSKIDTFFSSGQCARRGGSLSTMAWRD